MQFNSTLKVYVLDSTENLEVPSDSQMATSGCVSAIPLYKRDKSPEMQQLWVLSILNRVFAANLADAVSIELQEKAKMKINSTLGFKVV